MVPYHVTFAMPDWIAEGLAKGVYEAVGGVIRMVDGKKVVLWLRPALDDGIKQGIGASILPLGKLGAGAALSLAATATVGIMVVAGFAYMAYRHKQVEKRLDDIISRLDAIRTTVDDILANQIARARHEVQAALDTIATEEDQGNFDSLQGPILILRTNCRFYAEQMDRLLTRPVPLSSAPLFVEFAELFTVIAQAKARVLLLYAGEEAAEAEAEADRRIYAGLRDRFLAPLRDPDTHLGDFVQLTEEQDAAMRQYLPALPRPEALECVRMPGLTRDPVLLRALRDVATPRPGQPAAGIIPRDMAPPGWEPTAPLPATLEAR
jgi:hypothetical protein